MARNRGKKALYEVMSKARLKPDYGRTLERMHPKRADKDKSAIIKKPAAELSKTPEKWWRKPRIAQLNAGRIEFSMPYQLAVAVLLGLILLILAAFRLGQYSSPASRQAAEKLDQEKVGINQESQTGRATTNMAPVYAPAQSNSPNTRQVEPPKSTGNNVIVLVEYGTLADLGPVQAHFAENGIETEIVMEAGRYFLQTKDTYDNPKTPGTDGYEAIQKIIEIGAKYEGRAPAGYETFAPHFFKDAYGKRKVQ